MTVAPRRAIVGWVLFDWAAQPFFTLITTFVYAPYFASAVATDPARGPGVVGLCRRGGGPHDRVALARARRDRRRGRAAQAVDRGVRRAARRRLDLLWFGKPGDPSARPAGADRLCDRGDRRRIRRRVQQRHDADAGAAGAARPAVGHRLGDRLCGRAGEPRDRARLAGGQSADRQDADRPHAVVRPRSGDCAKATAQPGRCRRSGSSSSSCRCFCSRRTSRARCRCARRSAGLRHARRHAAPPAATTATPRCSCSPT